MIPAISASIASTAKSQGGVTADDFTVDLPSTTQSVGSYEGTQSADARWRFGTDGQVDYYQKTGGWTNDDHTWGTPSSVEGQGIGEFFEIKATLDSGSLASGTTGSWMALTSVRTWRVYDPSSAIPNQTANLTIEVRKVGGASSEDSQTYTLTADYEGF